MDIIQNRRVLVKRASDAVAAKLANDAEMMRFRDTLNRGGNIRDRIAGNRGLDRAKERLFGHIQQVLDFGRNAPIGTVTAESP